MPHGKGVAVVGAVGPQGQEEEREQMPVLRGGDRFVPEQQLDKQEDGRAGCQTEGRGRGMSSGAVGGGMSLFAGFKA